MPVIKNTQDFSPEFLSSKYDHFAIIGLGSNLGDRAANLLRAISLLIGQGINLIAISNIYETAPEDYLNQPNFLNMIILAADNNLPPPHKLLSLCLEIELELKRERTSPKGPRTIDLDLLIYDDLVITSSSDLVKYYPESVGFSLELILPHPRMHERGFVLVPLVEIIPTALHPKLLVSYKNLLEKLDVTGKVNPYQG